MGTKGRSVIKCIHFTGKTGWLIVGTFSPSHLSVASLFVPVIPTSSTTSCLIYWQSTFRSACMRTDWRMSTLGAENWIHTTPNHTINRERGPYKCYTDYLAKKCEKTQTRKHKFVSWNLSRPKLILFNLVIWRRLKFQIPIMTLIKLEAWIDKEVQCIG
jgi:hypothetical protein